MSDSATATVPFLSVVIPTFNRRASLEVTLHALARQHEVSGGYEVIVVSDGSTDGTDSCLAEWAARSDVPYALRVVNQPNGGPAKARNRGVAEARGIVVAFLDDDVEPLPQCLAVHAARHRDDPMLVLIGPMSPDPQRRDSEPVWIAWEHAMLEKQYSSFRLGVWRDDDCGPNNFYTGNASVRREHILRVGGFDEGFARQEDVELAVRLERECKVHFRFDPNLGALHRPTRTFASWLRVPYAYGKLDVVRAQRGDASWTRLRDLFLSRQRATRILARFVLPNERRGAVVRGTLRRAAEVLYALPSGAAQRLGLNMLSALYNVHYLEGARDELGAWPALRDVLAEPVA